MASHIITPFDFQYGRILAGKYRVEQKIGEGWEGEVYKISEIKTEIPRAAKFYYPLRNPHGKTVIRYSQKLNRLSNCRIIMRYMHQDSITFRRERVEFMVSEYIDGNVLFEYQKNQPGNRFSPFEALLILESLCKGMETVHNMGEYHGDIHSENVLVEKQGVSYRVKLIDFYDWNGTRKEKIFTDVVDLVRILYDMIGGSKHYRKMPPQIKSICCGLKTSLIRKKFRTAGELRSYIHQLQW